MKRLLAVFILICSAVPARAVFLGGVDQNFGKRDYVGTDVYGGLNLDSLSITPEYRRWSDQDSNGGFNTFQARVGYDMRWFGAGITGGTTLRHLQYSNVFGGADFAFTLSPLGDTNIRRIGGTGRGGAPVGKGLARVDFGGGILSTHHKQDATTTAAGATLTQNDAHAFVGGSFLNVLLSGRFTKSFYDHDLKTLNATDLPTPQYEPIAGHLFYNAASYPSQSTLLSAEFTMLPMVAPFVSFTHTMYKQVGTVQPGDTRAYAAGVRVGLEMLAVQASYQRLSVTAGDDTNYTSIGASLRF